MRICLCFLVSHRDLYYHCYLIILFIALGPSSDFKYGLMPGAANDFKYGLMPGAANDFKYGLLPGTSNDFKYGLLPESWPKQETWENGKDWFIKIRNNFSNKEYRFQG